MSTIELELPENVLEFARKEADRQGFASVNAFFAAVLTRATENQPLIERELLDGIASGPATPLQKSDFEDVRDRIRNRSV